MEKITYFLNGERDRNRDVFMAGHGIYWIAYDATDFSKKEAMSLPSIRANMNRAHGGRALYCILVIAAIAGEGDGVTRYWIAKGMKTSMVKGGREQTRQNTRKHMSFSRTPAHGIVQANLSVLEIAGNRGQPDYVQFNGKNLGVSYKTVNGTGITDIEMRSLSTRRVDPVSPAGMSMPRRST
jgi:hypothetical protein